MMGTALVVIVVLLVIGILVECDVPRLLWGMLTLGVLWCCGRAAQAEVLGLAEAQDGSEEAVTEKQDAVAQREAALRKVSAAQTPQMQAVQTVPATGSDGSTTCPSKALIEGEGNCKASQHPLPKVTGVCA